jgi:hypothetical protein
MTDQEERAMSIFKTSFKVCPLSGYLHSSANKKAERVRFLSTWLSVLVESFHALVWPRRAVSDS